jgi:tyrosyl-tRNA synthetase
VQRREAPEEIPTLRYAVTTNGSLTIFADSGESEVALTAPPADVVHALGLASRKAEAKRLVAQGAVEVDGTRVTDALTIGDGIVVKVGKRKFVRLVAVKST